MNGQPEPAPSAAPLPPPPTVFPPPVSGAGPYPQAPPKGPTWPTPIGVVCIVLAGLGLVSQPLNMILQRIDPNQAAIYKLFPAWYSQFAIYSMIVGSILSIILLAGGILLIKRRQVAKYFSLLYAVLALAWLCVNYSILLGGGLAARLTGAMKIAWYGGLLGGLPFALAAPVFLIFWFLRAKTKADMRDWK
ncbi:MAG: hypothetical protein HZA50_12405 [Planctomycetes bacterium]|nr:hypothetical protein [Planctomycetota bacterium]